MRRIEYFNNLSTQSDKYNFSLTSMANAQKAANAIFFTILQSSVNLSNESIFFFFVPAIKLYNFYRCLLESNDYHKTISIELRLFAMVCQLTATTNNRNFVHNFKFFVFTIYRAPNTARNVIMNVILEVDLRVICATEINRLVLVDKQI